MLQKGNDVLQDFNAAIACEWIETNGLGGWSSSSVIGCNTRRYHGLLIAAVQPPTERISMVSKMDETIVCGPHKYELGTNDYGQVVQPTGYRYMTGFTRDLFPCFTYHAGGTVLKKTIAMAQGENTVIIRYEVIKAAGPFILELMPLITARYYHSLASANPDINTAATYDNGIFSLAPYPGDPELFIKIPGADYRAGPDWYYHFKYSIEEERGLDAEEDLFTPGVFALSLAESDTAYVLLSTSDPLKKDARSLLIKEEERKRSLLRGYSEGETMKELVLAADQFIVQRAIKPPDDDKVAAGAGAAEDGATVIAGYHWFTDWSRDTMISLPGLTLSTGRHSCAKKILSAFIPYVSMGMLPNRFADNGGAPEYNTVDGTLWYFIAVYKYLQSSGDEDFVLRKLLPVLKEVIDWHFKGTRYHIHATADGLLYAGEPGQQLTWMDAKVDDWVVTPRMGKPVEVEALWYNALKILASLLRLNKQPGDAAEIDTAAETAKQSFNQVFWNASGGYLFDVIDEKGMPDAQFRPNQLFAISLPFALTTGNQALSVLNLVTAQLYTPVGLRSLSPADPHFVPVYKGDRYTRDGAYHQGTVWSWLLGPYIDALVKLDPVNGKAEAKKVVDAFSFHLDEAGIGTVSEIFDGGWPHIARGCIAQAWGVAELLRVIKEYGL